MTSITRTTELEKTPGEISFNSKDIPNETHLSHHSPSVQEDKSSWKSWGVQLAHCQQWASLPGEVLLSGLWPGTAAKHPRSGQSLWCWNVSPSTHFKQIPQALLCNTQPNVSSWAMKSHKSHSPKQQGKMWQNEQWTSVTKTQWRRVKGGWKFLVRVGHRKISCNWHFF